MSAKSSYQRWQEWRLRVVADSNQHEYVKNRQREQKRKERAKFKEKASNAQLESKRAADRERQRRRRARLKAARLSAQAPDRAHGSPANGAATLNEVQNTGGSKGFKQTVAQQERGKPKVKSRGRSMKIRVNGLISTRTPKKSDDDFHDRSNVRSKGQIRVEAKVSGTGRSSALGAKSGARTLNNKRFHPEPEPIVGKNNNLKSLPSLSCSASKKQNVPEQDHPLCLKKVPLDGADAVPIAKQMGRDSKRTLFHHPDHLNRSNSASVCKVDQALSGRKRSRKQSVPLKYVALSQAI